jgi:hypothetical protein
MNIIVIVLTLLVLFITTDKKLYTREYFNTNISEPLVSSFMSNNTGKKGVLFNHLGDHNIYKLPKIHHRNINYDKTIKQLELYPKNTYDECVSKYNPDNLNFPIVNDDPMNDYLNINVGVIS